MKRHVYIGTYSRPAPYLAATNGTGIVVGELDEATGEIEVLDTVEGIENSSYLTLSPDGGTLHAIWEVPEWPAGLVSSYRRNPESGELSFLGVQSSKGTIACYVTTDAAGSFGFVANYLSGEVAMFPIGRDGSLSEACSVVNHVGRGPDPIRQEGPHAHCVVVDPEDRFCLSADLGADRIFTHAIDRERARLVPHAEVALAPGSGPRHLVFHPSGRLVLLIEELTSRVTSLGYDPESGTLEPIATVDALPTGFEGDSHCADIQVHPSGRHLYGSNRGHDSITIIDVDAGSGALEVAGHRSTEGATPRNFAITPTGKHLLAANQDSDTVVTFPIESSGLLGDPVATTQVPTPVCVKVAP